MGYLLGLINVKYVCVPQKHYFSITNMGKQALGLPNLDKNLAQKILSSVSLEKAFHFYYNIDNYTGVYANSLKDFIDKIQTIDLRCITFHLSRRDFEKWVHSLGDVELSRKLGLIRMSKISGENLRKRLFETLNCRYDELEKLSS
jgi:hypothetical protein